MRTFKIILSVLLLLVVGLIVLQLISVRMSAPSLDDIPGFIPQASPTNGLPESEDLSSNFVSAVDHALEPLVTALISGSEETDLVWASQTPAAKRVRKVFPSLGWMTNELVRS